MKNKVSPPKTDPSTYTINPALKSLANDPFIIEQGRKLSALLNKNKDWKSQNF